MFTNPGVGQPSVDFSIFYAYDIHAIDNNKINALDFTKSGKNGL